ncbi:MAG: serine hydrolase domain-containing protein [Pseudomonadota bacterium]
MHKSALLPYCLPMAALLSVTLLAQGLNAEEAELSDAPAWRQRIAEAAIDELEKSSVPSLQIAIGINGKIVYDRAFGLADVEHQVAATTKTKYRSASISKWMTAAAAMRLADQRKLDLDAPIQTYCPEFPEKRWTVTPRHLLTHTSGIRHYADYEAELEAAANATQRAAIERRRDRDALGEYTRYTDVLAPLESFKHDPLEFEPGTAWLYTSFGYRVLGCVLRGAAKRSYTDIMQSEIFDPAAMSNTLADDAWQIIPHRATGYRVSKGQPLRRADMRDVSENLPAGGHLTTAADLVAFALAFRSRKIVSASATALLSRPLNPPGTAASEAPSWRNAIPSENHYGYGVMFFPGGDYWLGHSGRQAGGSAIVMQAPASDLSIAVMTNAKGWQGFISFTGTLKDIAEAGLRETP